MRVIGSMEALEINMSDLMGFSIARRSFKLPNPMSFYGIGQLSQCYYCNSFACLEVLGLWSFTTFLSNNLYALVVLKKD